MDRVDRQVVDRQVVDRQEVDLVDHQEVDLVDRQEEGHMVVDIGLLYPLDLTHQGCYTHNQTTLGTTVWPLREPMLQLP